MKRKFVEISFEKFKNRLNEITSTKKDSHEPIDDDEPKENTIDDDDLQKEQPKLNLRKKRVTQADKDFLAEWAIAFNKILDGKDDSI